MLRRTGYPRRLPWAGDVPRGAAAPPAPRPAPALVVRRDVRRGGAVFQARPPLRAAATVGARAVPARVVRSDLRRPGGVAWSRPPFKAVPLVPRAVPAAAVVPCVKPPHRGLVRLFTPVHTAASGPQFVASALVWDEPLPNYTWD